MALYALLAFALLPACSNHEPERSGRPEFLKVRVATSLTGIRSRFYGLQGLALAPATSEPGWCATLWDPDNNEKPLHRLCHDEAQSFAWHKNYPDCPEISLDLGNDKIDEAVVAFCVSKDKALPATSVVDIVVGDKMVAGAHRPPSIAVEPGHIAPGDKFTIRWGGDFAPDSRLQFRVWQLRQPGWLYWQSEELVVSGSAKGTLPLLSQKFWPATNSNSGSAYVVVPVLNGVEYGGVPLVLQGASQPEPVPSGMALAIDEGKARTDDPVLRLGLSASHASFVRIGTKSNLADEAWYPFRDSYSFHFGLTDGTRTVYAQFAASTGKLASPVSDSIVFAYKDSDLDNIPDSRDNDRDGDGVVNDEDAFPDNPDEAVDTDSDGIGNNADKDDDNDGMPDSWEQTNGLDPLVDDAMLDPDNDALANAGEYLAGTDPHDSDSDNDGMPDGWEVSNGTDPLVSDNAADHDGDGLNNLQEYQNGSSPATSDTDHDGLTDGAEVGTYGTDPALADSDGDGIPDGWEVSNALNPLLDDAGLDGDNDNLNNLGEFGAGSDPGDPDSDNDGLLDGSEINTWFTSAVSNDSDSDGMPDGWEVNHSLDPLANDAALDPDGDGLSNLQEYLAGSDPHNRVPSVSSVSFGNGPFYKSDTLTAIASAVTDFEGASITLKWRWFVNGLTVPSATGSTLSGTWFGRGQSVQVRVIPNDGKEDGLPVYSVTVTIANSPPQLLSASLGAGPFQTGSTLSVTPQGWNDADGDVPGYLYLWYRNGISVANEYTASLTGAYFVRGDQLYVKVTPFDGFEGGSPVNAPAITIANSPPEITGVTLGTAPFYTNQNLTVTPQGWTDADGDSPGYSVLWYVNGLSIPGEYGLALTSSYFVRGDVVFARVSPWDGYAMGGTTDSASVSIVNRPPSAPSIQLYPELPTAGTGLWVAIATPSNDADGDTVLYGYRWFKNDTDQGYPINQTFVAGINVAMGDRWKVEVTPNDGFVDGSTATTERVVVGYEMAGANYFVQWSAFSGIGGAAASPSYTLQQSIGSFGTPLNIVPMQSPSYTLQAGPLANE